jgi:hypothetical protein
MKVFRELEIKSSETNLVELLSKLKSINSKQFVFMKKETKDCASNIFTDEKYVACFKAASKTNFESLIWLNIKDEELRVLNITSKLVSVLGYDRYNIVLCNFYHNFVEQHISSKYEVRLSDDFLTMELLISKKSFKALNAWEDLCDKNAPLAHPCDRERWFEFIKQIIDNKDELSSGYLEKWLEEDKGWYRDVEDDYNVITRTIIDYENGRDLLIYYTNGN